MRVSVPQDNRRKVSQFASCRTRFLGFCPTCGLICRLARCEHREQLPLESHVGEHVEAFLLLVVNASFRVIALSFTITAPRPAPPLPLLRRFCLIQCCQQPPPSLHVTSEALVSCVRFYPIRCHCWISNILPPPSALR